jgi:16S rRNA (guanine(966)-N(2))-methyltransferase RsmD
MVREALFSILGDAVPGRPFLDLFAGTGVVGLEAVSRGAGQVTLIERDFRVAGEIERHIRQFHVADQAAVVRADVYRWAERWPAPAEPVTLFLGPPYPDFERRPHDLLALIGGLQQKIAPGSVLVVQSEQSPTLDRLPDRAHWEVRRYGRNHLLIWVKEATDHAPVVEQP